jgi:hypothetical protein
MVTHLIRNRAADLTKNLKLLHRQLVSSLRIEISENQSKEPILEKSFFVIFGNGFGLGLSIKNCPVDIIITSLKPPRLDVTWITPWFIVSLQGIPRRTDLWCKAQSKCQLFPSTFLPSERQWSDHTIQTYDRCVHHPPKVSLSQQCGFCFHLSCK